MVRQVVLDDEQFRMQTRSVMEGGTLELSVQIKDGTPPYSYTWTRHRAGGVLEELKDGGFVTGATTGKLRVEWNGSLAGAYSVSVGRTVDGVLVGNRVSSGSVSIGEVLRPKESDFSIKVSLEGDALVQGSTLKLTVQSNEGAALAGLPRRYQWRLNSVLLREGSLFSGADTEALTIKGFNANAVGDYEVVVRNDAGQATLKRAVGFSMTPVRKLSELASMTVMQGDRVEWEAFRLEGGGTLNYMWVKAGTGNVAGGSSALSFESVKTSDAGTYALTVSNAISAASSAARLRVFTPPVFENIRLMQASVVSGTQQSVTLSEVPLSAGANAQEWTAEIKPGDRVVLSADALGGVDSASGVSGLRYQWMRGGSPISGGTGRTYAISSVREADVNAPYSVSLSVVDPESRRVLVEAADSGKLRGGAVRLKLRPALTPPSILSGGVVLSGGTVFAGGSLALEARTSSQQVTYQWLYNGVVLSDGLQANVGSVTGAGGSLLSIRGVGAAASGSYAVRVSSDLNRKDVQTASFGLQVLVPARITQQPASVRVVEKSEVRLRVAAEGTNSGTYAITYKWRRNGEFLSESDVYSGVDKPTLVISGSADPVEAEGQYDVVVDNRVGAAVSSSAAVVTVVVTPLRLELVGAGTVLAGMNCELKLVVKKDESGVDGAGYQWRRNGKPIPGAGGRTDREGVAVLKIVAGSANAGEYDALVTSGGQSIVSPASTLLVREPVRITRDLIPMLGVVPGTQQSGGSFAALSVGAGGSGVLSYKWRKFEGNGKDALEDTTFSAASSPFLDLASEASDVMAWYSVEVTAGTEISLGGTSTTVTSARVPVQLLAAVSEGMIQVPPAAPKPTVGPWLSQ
jgi:hypothetical protein